jgi:hypothetical protein
LPADQKAFWHAYAAMAIEKCTLTPHTVAGFRLLTELAARKDRTARMLVITEDLVSGEDGAPHLATLLQLGRLHALLAQRVEGLLGRFGLAPFGRAEEAVPRRKAAPNPFEQLSGVPERGER